MQLPDGNEIQVGPDRFKVPEVFFQPVCCSAPWMPALLLYDNSMLPNCSIVAFIVDLQVLPTSTVANNT